MGIPAYRPTPIHHPRTLLMDNPPTNLLIQLPDAKKPPFRGLIGLIIGKTYRLTIINIGKTYRLSIQDRGLIVQFIEEGICVHIGDLRRHDRIDGRRDLRHQFQRGFFGS